MTVVTRLGVYLVVLVFVFAVAFGIGHAVGPVGDSGGSTSTTMAAGMEHGHGS